MELTGRFVFFLYALGLVFAAGYTVLYPARMIAFQRRMSLTPYSGPDPDRWDLMATRIIAIFATAFFALVASLVANSIVQAFAHH